MVAIQDDLARAFAKVQEEPVINEEEESVEVAHEADNINEEAFYTKAYVPLAKEEIEHLIK